MSTDQSTDTTTAVEKMGPRTEDLRMIQSFEDAVMLAQDVFGDVADASTEIGDGFTMLEDKDVLIKRGFILVGWNFADGDYTNEHGEKSKFVAARVVTETGDKYVMIDGGTGICAQLMDYTARTGKQGGLLVRQGLRKSSYEHPIHGPGVTHYLNV